MTRRFVSAKRLIRYFSKSNIIIIIIIIITSETGITIYNYKSHRKLVNVNRLGVTAEYPTTGKLQPLKIVATWLHGYMAEFSNFAAKGIPKGTIKLK